MEARKPKIVKAPEGCASYLTAGKEYPVTGIWQSWHEKTGYCFHINDDRGYKLFCKEKSSSHIDYGNWIIVEYEKRFAMEAHATPEHQTFGTLVRWVYKHRAKETAHKQEIDNLRQSYNDLRQEMILVTDEYKEKMRILEEEIKELPDCKKDRDPLTLVGEQKLEIWHRLRHLPLSTLQELDKELCSGISELTEYLIE